MDTCDAGSSRGSSWVIRFGIVDPTCCVSVSSPSIGNWIGCQLDEALEVMLACDASVFFCFSGRCPEFGGVGGGLVATFVGSWLVSVVLDLFVGKGVRDRVYVDEFVELACFVDIGLGSFRVGIGL